MKITLLITTTKLTAYRFHQNDRHFDLLAFSQQQQKNNPLAVYRHPSQKRTLGRFERRSAHLRVPHFGPSKSYYFQLNKQTLLSKAQPKTLVRPS